MPDVFTIVSKPSLRTKNSISEAGRTSLFRNWTFAFTSKFPSPVGTERTTGMEGLVEEATEGVVDRRKPRPLREGKGKGSIRDGTGETLEVAAKPPPTPRPEDRDGKELLGEDPLDELEADSDLMRDSEEPPPRKTRIASRRDTTAPSSWATLSREIFNSLS